MTSCRSLRAVPRALGYGCLVCCVVAVGCSSRPARIAAANVDCPEVARQLIAMFDTDASETLAASEADASAYLGAMFSQYDADSDGVLTESEIADRLASDVFNPRVAFMEYSCLVRHNGRPLAGATVTLTPLPSLQAALPAATAVTDAAGLARPAVAKEDLPQNAPPLAGFMPPGLYLLRVDHPTKPIASPYGPDSQFIAEVSPTALVEGSPVFEVGK